MVFKVPRLRLSLHPQIPPRMQLQRYKKNGRFARLLPKSCNLFLVLTLYSGRKNWGTSDLEKYVVDVLRVRRPRTLSTSPTYGLFGMNHSVHKDN